MSRILGNGLDRLMKPNSIAIIGASSHEEKPGFRILKNIAGRWKGELYAVNPSQREILGVKCYSSIEDLPDNVDLAVISLGAKDSVIATEACARKNFGVVIPIAGGFSETGKEGKILEEDLRRIILSSNTRVLGPNSLGVFVPGSGLDTIFVEHGDRMFASPHGVAFITQSGSIGTEALGYAGVKGWGLSAWVGLGNRIDINENELLEYFLKDKQTLCIALYLETFADGRDFIDKCRIVARKKPVVILKAGRGSVSAQAVCSHTGRLAKGGNAFTGIARQLGVVLAKDEIDLVDFARILSMEPPAFNPGVAVVSTAGGFGVLAMDEVEESENLYPASLSNKTISRLRRKILPFASTRNPVDLTGSADDSMIAHALACLEDDPHVGIIILMEFLSPPKITERQFEILTEHRKRTKKPFVVFSIFGPYTDRILFDLYGKGVAGFDSVRRAVRAASVLVERGRFLKKTEDEKKKNAIAGAGNLGKFKNLHIITKYSEVSEYDLKQFFKCNGIDIPEGIKLCPEDDSEIVKGKFPSLVAVKILDSKIYHKTEVGGVVLNVSHKDILQVVKNMRKNFPGKDILVEEMVFEPGVELIAGAMVDEDFGPVVMVGMGGIYAEIYRDVTYRCAPLSRSDVEDMLDSLKSKKVFSDFRGRKLAISEFEKILIMLGSLISKLKDKVSQIDLNPVLLTSKRAIVLDAKIIFTEKIPVRSNLSR